MFLRNAFMSTFLRDLSVSLKGICSAVGPKQASCSALPSRLLSVLGTSGDTEGLRKPGIHPVRHYARAVRKKQEIQSQLSDLAPTLLKMDYAPIPLAQTANDVVKKLLTLELASHRDKLLLKEEQLIAKVQKHKTDRSSVEVRVAILTARIRNYQEHLQKHPKDKANKRRMLMSMDRRKKRLKFLRRTHYESFENVCQQLGITYTFPPQYYRRATRRWLAKKALCIKVYREVQKQRAAQRDKGREAEAPPV